MKLGKPVGKVQQLPAYRYELFINAYEKKVAEIQESIRRMEKMERLYNLVVNAASPFRLPNDQSLILNENSVMLSIKAAPDDLLATFDKLAFAVGEELRNAGLHKEGVPATGSNWRHMEYKFRVGSFDPRKDRERPTVSIIVELPEAGVRDADIKSEQCTYTYTAFSIHRRHDVRPIGWSQNISTKV